MPDWEKYYDEHLITLEQAAEKINSGDKIFFGQTITISYPFLDLLYKREDLTDVGIYYNCSSGMFDMVFDADSKKRFHIMTMFSSPLDRMSGSMGICDFNSNPYEYFTRSIIDEYGCNTMVVEICPPDENGRCNLGVLGIPSNGLFNADPHVVKKIGIINHDCAFPAQGDYEEVTIPLTDFDYIVINDHEPSVLPVSAPTEVDKIIASYILPYIKEGDSIQVGMGGLGEQITAELKNKSNINIFTEIAVDSMVELAEAGILNSITACGAFGTTKIFDFLAKSDKVKMKPVSYMLEPPFISQVDNLVGINQTLMVDLLGQACSEAQGLKMYSGVGGSFGFIYGITKSKGGRSFLCLRSTYTDKEGKVRSNVVPWLPEGSIVTTPKYLVMYLVSENGIADVFLKTNRDRIKAIMKIAHPDFLPELKEKIISTGQIAEEDFDS